MLRDEITYAILELIRAGSVVDDEKIDLRLINEFIRSKRVEFATIMSDSTKVLPEHFYQYITITSKTPLFTGTPTEKVYKLADMPKVVCSRSLPLITEITSASATDGYVAVLDLPYKLVNPQAFKYSGNGRFNSNWIFATYRDNDLIVKSKGASLPSITRFVIKAVFEDPEDVSGFDVEVDDYPVSKQGFEYIKNAILTTDLKIFVSAESDTTNDSSGS